MELNEILYNDINNLAIIFVLNRVVAVIINRRAADK